MKNNKKTVITLTGSEDGMKRLKSLIESGELREIAGFKILSFEKVDEFLDLNVRDNTVDI